jgi:hypothetical protein
MDTGAKQHAADKLAHKIKRFLGKRIGKEVNWLMLCLYYYSPDKMKGCLRQNSKSMTRRYNIRLWNRVAVTACLAT